ncbi:hypothetical protein PGQ11_010231 [Apiospora arundinis]|uniref:Homeobox domain-containing protein n=1 Tax=Apiospora arundinis TaxID=335852 RepID=A0ABR2IA56_9PEZI
MSDSISISASEALVLSQDNLVLDEVVPDIDILRNAYLRNPKPNASAMREIIRSFPNMAEKKVRLRFCEMRRKDGIARTQISAGTKKYLEDVYSYNQRPDDKAMQEIADRISKTKTQVQDWFRKERYKMGITRKQVQPHNKKILEDAYKQNPYPDSILICKIKADIPDMTEVQIENWMKRRRRNSCSSVRAPSDASNTSDNSDDDSEEVSSDSGGEGNNTMLQKLVSPSSGPGCGQRPEDAAS